LRNYHFLWLAQYNPEWNSHESLSDEKSYDYLTCLLHYNLSIAHMMRFLGNNYTGSYRDIPSIVASLQNHGISKTLLAHYSGILQVGCLNHFNACTMHENALLYWRQGNHPSIKMKIDQVMFTMNEEERNNYIIHVPHWLWWFVPHCFITPQHILEKPGKKDRQIFNAARKCNWDLIPVNAMTSTPLGSKLKCQLSKVHDDILILAYNLCILYPDDDIVVHANDFKLCCRQIKHHPNVTAAFSYILVDYLFFQIGLAFGTNFSLVNWEAVH
jgi:hypothetical protein